MATNTLLAGICENASQRQILNKEKMITTPCDNCQEKQDCFFEMRDPCKKAIDWEPMQKTDFFYDEVKTYLRNLRQSTRG